MLPKRFLCKFFNGSNSKNEIQINYVGQYFLYTVSYGRFLTTKHVLLPFTVKSLTRYADLEKMMNPLSYGVSSYSKVLEIVTTITNSKLSSSTTLIPNNIYQHISARAVYDNIDRLEEALSRCGTTHRKNGVFVQQAFIGLSLPPVISCKEKTKKRSIEVPQLTMLVETQNFLFFHDLIKNYQQKAFRYN